MQTVHIALDDRSYDIRIGSGLLGSSNEFLPWIEGEQVFIVTDKVVAPLYLHGLRRALAGKSVYEVILPAGEATKNMDTITDLFDAMLNIPLDRSATVVALGGGVIGDMAGFAAACYQRGIAFIQVPTTLLAQVDSSVGGKTGVNHALGKNMIGAFHQPVRVVADCATLATLPPREFSAGLAEVIKYGLIDDPPFFAWLEANMAALMQQDAAVLACAVERSCIAKARIVEQDERESGVRALLNLGHTFGHAVETATGYSHWLHGEAVAFGMLLAAWMSARMGWLASAEVERVRTLLARANLPTEPSLEFSAKRIRQLMTLDKKVKAGHIRLVLLRGIGRAVLTDEYEEGALLAALNHFCRGSSQPS